MFEGTGYLSVIINASFFFLRTHVPREGIGEDVHRSTFVIVYVTVIILSYVHLFLGLM
ncbi:hypothetical protein M378DRAFT_163134, partial [Amanita muscaria Koide BX008]